VKSTKAAFILAGSSLFTAAAFSATSADVARLGQDLTSAGAEQAASKDGLIPSFEGESKPLAGWAYGKVREDSWKHKDEKALFVIDASNVDKYADKLTAGQVQMLKQVKGYTMPVYLTHRECGLPDFVAQDTKEGAPKRQLRRMAGRLTMRCCPAFLSPFRKPASK
jgi:hypothetical protein